MLPFGMTIPTTLPQRSEIQEALMNYPVLNTAGKFHTEHIQDTLLQAPKQQLKTVNK
jgi:hypothetical protein